MKSTVNERFTKFASLLNNARPRDGSPRRRVAYLPRERLEPLREWVGFSSERNISSSLLQLSAWARRVSEYDLSLRQVEGLESQDFPISGGTGVTGKRCSVVKVRKKVLLDAPKKT